MAKALLFKSTDGGWTFQAKDGQRLLVGRGSDVDVRIDDPFFDKRCAYVTRRGDKVTVEEAGGTTSIFVNDKAIHAPTIVRPGDRVRLGPITFILEVED